MSSYYGLEAYLAATREEGSNTSRSPPQRDTALHS